MDDKWEFYKDGAGEWRWRRTAANGRITGASTQGYKEQERLRRQCQAQWLERLIQLNNNIKSFIAATVFLSNQPSMRLLSYFRLYDKQ